MSFIFDTRWEDLNGIGRMTLELRTRLFAKDDFVAPRWPASAVNPFDPFVQGLRLLATPRSLLYSPGFNPPAFAQSRAVFTLCDLIHLRVPGEAGWVKRQYYERLVKPAVHRAFRVLTISEYSRRDVLDWSGARHDKLVNIGCGVDPRFFERVVPWQPGFPYFLYVGARKPHKNLLRLLEAYAGSNAARELRLVLSGGPDAEVFMQASALGITDRLHFAGRIPDAQLPAYYQGATALLFPSYFEGFGLPPLEAMAGGTPALTGNATSLPEVVGKAALTVDPFSVDELRDGIDRLAFDDELRNTLIAAGPIQARLHSWDVVASKVSVVLTELRNSIKQ